MNEETRAVDVYENEPADNGKLKVFGIVAIALGVLKFVARLVIYLHFNVEKLINTSPNSKKIIDVFNKNNTSMEQVNDAFKSFIITYAVIGLIVLVVIGILAIRAASTGKAKGILIVLIIYLIYTVLCLIFSFGVHSLLGVFGILTIIVTIIGIVFANKVNKQ